MALQFIDPPASRSERGFMHDEIASELKANPGKFALIMENVSSVHASAINRGEKVAYRPAGTFKAVSRKVADGKHNIFAKYVGDSEE